MPALSSYVCSMLTHDLSCFFTLGGLHPCCFVEKENTIPMSIGLASVVRAHAKGKEERGVNNPFLNHTFGCELDSARSATSVEGSDL